MDISIWTQSLIVIRRRMKREFAGFFSLDARAKAIESALVQARYDFAAEKLRVRDYLNKLGWSEEDLKAMESWRGGRPKAQPVQDAGTMFERHLDEIKRCLTDEENS